MRGLRQQFVLAVTALAVAATGLAACGNSGNEDTPVACVGGAEAFRQALAGAPGEVRLGGGTKISDCVVDGQAGGQLASTGQALVLAATQLNEAARRDPGGPEAVQLGYLVGALTGAGSDSQGIHTELVRRIEAAALYSPAGKPPPQPFDREYRKGYAAGRQDG